MALRYDLTTQPWTVRHFLEGTQDIHTPADLAASALPVLSAKIPGNYEIDLQNAGEIEDPFLGLNTLKLRPYEFHQFWYETSFQTPADLPRPELVFDGLDCIAEIWLNDRLVGNSDNALIAHHFDVAEFLAPVGENNRLAVCIKSAANALRDVHLEHRAGFQTGDRSFLRKPAHAFGWDIMGRLVSGGIWRPVYLQGHPDNEIDDLYIQTKSCDENSAILDVQVHFTTSRLTTEGLAMRVRGRCGDSVFESVHALWSFNEEWSFKVEEPKLWWPRGYGDAALYDVTVELLYNDEVLATRETRVGIRTIELDRTDLNTPEQPGHFVFKVNDVPIMAKGSNWVPADALHSRDVERIPKMLALFREMGCNIVRCWGGNVYETHQFYDLCDEYGILVWQDFAMACLMYPQDDAFLAKIRAEAEFVIRENRQHACIALWAGDNENDCTYWCWNGRRRIDPAKNRITREVLPQVVDRLDPLREYLPSSPYLAPAVVARGKYSDEDSPERHLWGPRGYYKDDFYKKHNACFASETGYHGCPAASSIRKFITPAALWPWKHNREWLLHSTDAMLDRGEEVSRIELMSHQIELVFGKVPEEIEDYVTASQVVQAEAKKFFVELFRQRKWQTSGIIWWNMIDGWPQMSDAIVDYYFVKKLAFHYLKRVHRELCVIVGESDCAQAPVIACNDSRRERHVRLQITRGIEKRLVLEAEFTVPPNENLTVGAIDANHDEQDLFLLEWESDGERAVNHYLLGRPPFDLAQMKQWLEIIRNAEPFVWER